MPGFDERRQGTGNHVGGQFVPDVWMEFNMQIREIDLSE
jgi:hypothetical protein